MSRHTILTFAALTIAALGAFGCGGGESTTTAVPADVVQLRAGLLAREADTVLLRLGVPEGWKKNEDANLRLPIAAIDKPQGGDCGFVVQIVAGPPGVRGTLQPGETKLLRLLRRGRADKRSVKVVAPGPGRLATFGFRIFDARGELSPTGPAAISIGELRIAGTPAIPPLVIIARGGLDGCPTYTPTNVINQTRAALRVLNEHLSVEIRE